MKASPGFAGLVVGFVVVAAIKPLAPATGASIDPARARKHHHPTEALTEEKVSS